MRLPIVMNVEIMPGTSVDDAITSAKILANHLDISYVCFKFNGIDVSVSQNACCRSLVERVMKDMKTGNTIVVG